MDLHEAAGNASLFENFWQILADEIISRISPNSPPNMRFSHENLEQIEKIVKRCCGATSNATFFLDHALQNYFSTTAKSQNSTTEFCEISAARDEQKSILGKVAPYINLEFQETQNLISQI